MSRELFVDTSAWFALVEPKDRRHFNVATQLRSRISDGFKPVTTNLVIAETHALLLTRSHRAAALAFLRGVRTPPNAVVISDEEIEKRAQHAWIERYADQTFSLTDAVSFTVMTERGINEALTLDRHFTTAGFTRVP